mmetsp:Transcript_29236/g.86566  ORF Transcript_29236/g.86566 Transcript_29236/m.86566 type:complete len:268 (+) Transcript_29236:871-1674(+)
MGHRAVQNIVQKRGPILRRKRIPIQIPPRRRRGSLRRDPQRVAELLPKIFAVVLPLLPYVGKLAQIGTEKDRTAGNQWGAPVHHPLLSKFATGGGRVGQTAAQSAVDVLGRQLILLGFVAFDPDEAGRGRAHVVESGGGDQVAVRLPQRLGVRHALLGELPGVAAPAALRPVPIVEVRIPLEMERFPHARSIVVALLLHDRVRTVRLAVPAFVPYEIVGVHPSIEMTHVHGGLDEIVAVGDDRDRNVMIIGRRRRRRRRGGRGGGRR